MPTFNFDVPWQFYLMWQAIGLGGAFILNSFVEWTTHKFVMHKFFRLIPYGYEHTTRHHRVFGHDETYTVQADWMFEYGIGFTWREYVLFPIATALVYIPIELIAGVPVYGGAFVSVYMGLIFFDTLHRRFHNPKDTWFQRTRVFKFLNRHHWLHHVNHDINLNVVFPLADLCFGTLRRK